MRPGLWAPSVSTPARTISTASTVPRRAGARTRVSVIRPTGAAPARTGGRVQIVGSGSVPRVGTGRTVPACVTANGTTRKCTHRLFFPHRLRLIAALCFKLFHFHFLFFVGLLLRLLNRTCVCVCRCHPWTGKCLCEPGWSNSACDRPCRFLRYGQDCQLMCNCKNSSPCSHIDGSFKLIILLAFFLLSVHVILRFHLCKTVSVCVLLLHPFHIILLVYFHHFHLPSLPLHELFMFPI